MAHLPAAKLFSLFIKTLAKPVAKELKSRAAKHDTVKSGVIWMGQTYHKLSTIVSVRAAGFRTSSIKPLEERYLMLHVY